MSNAEARTPNPNRTSAEQALIDSLADALEAAEAKLADVLEDFETACIRMERAEAKIAALLSDEAVERACIGVYNDPNGQTYWNSLARVDPALADKYRAGQRAAIRAALGENA